jgi:two-component system, NarL family, sensor histidine kinase UhpB
VSVELVCERMTARLPAEIELALYRIVLKALENVAQHARAQHVVVRLSRSSTFVRMTIKDDGAGFDSARHSKERDVGGIGMLRMHERATYVGGTLKVTSTLGAGTLIEVRVPLSPILEAVV